MKFAKYAAASLLLFMVACSDEPALPDFRPGVSVEENYMVSSFSLERSHFAMPEDMDSVDIALIAQNGSTLMFGARVEHEDGMIRCHMHIPDSKPLPDGRYVMVMRNPSGASVHGRLVANFADKQLVSVVIVIPAYDLDGSGTPDDPYRITSDDDFNSFMMSLTDDETNAADLYFLQTADITPGDASTQIAGRGYWGAPFGGNYDGGGHAIRNLYYHGSGNFDTDISFGLFTELRGLAEVRNVSFTGVSVSGLAADGGILAGITTGNHRIENISIAGHIAAESVSECIGGLVGHVRSGEATFKNIDINASVSGGYYHTGGVVGCIDSGAAAIISGVTTSSKHFSVDGYNNVGGVIGCAMDGFTVTDVKLLHDVTSEDGDIHIITASSGAMGVGGVVGTVYRPHTREAVIRNAEVRCPVGGNGALSSVGGIVGNISLNSKDLVLDNCRFHSLANGSSGVGGILGVGYATSAALRVEGDDASTRVTVDNAAASVNGNSSVGGFIGDWNGKLDLRSRVKLNITVKGTNNSVGGVIGRALNSTVDVSRFIVGEGTDNGGDPVMKIMGTVDVGGIVGDLEKSTLQGSNAFDFAEKGHGIQIPKADRFISDFNCVVEGTNGVGGIVGSATESVVKAVSADCTVIGTGMGIGGIIGWFEEPGKNTLVEDCSFFGTVKAADARYVGGVIGLYKSQYRGRIHDSVNRGTVLGNSCVGGIVGYVDKTRPGQATTDNKTLTVQWCANAGEVNGASTVGGIVGEIHSGDPRSGYGGLDNDESDIDVLNCVNMAKITASGTSSGNSGVGGIVGFTNHRVKVASCANHGSILAAGHVHAVGGVAGSLGQDPTGLGIVNEFLNARIEFCCNTGSVDTQVSSVSAGGVLGYLEEGVNSHLANCYNKGHILAKTDRDTGGILGYADSNSTASSGVNYGTVDHGNACVGSHSGVNDDIAYMYYKEGSGKGWKATAVSAANMKNKSYFSKLNFDKIWTIGSEGPELRDCQWQSYRE